MPYFRVLRHTVMRKCFLGFKLLRETIAGFPHYLKFHFTPLCFYKRPTLESVFFLAEKKMWRGFSVIKWKLLLHFIPFQLTKGFIGMFYFQIVGEACSWFRSNLTIKTPVAISKECIIFFSVSFHSWWKFSYGKGLGTLFLPTSCSMINVKPDFGIGNSLQSSTSRYQL